MVYPVDWENVTCHDWYEEERKIWLCLENKNAICEIAKDNNSVTVLGNFPHNGLADRDLSLSVGKCGENIIFCPFQANDIAVFHMDTKKLEFIDIRGILEKHNYMWDGIEKFYRMFFYNNCVYFLGIRYPAILKLNLKTHEFTLFDGWREELERHKCKEAVFFTDGYARKEDTIFLPIGRCNGVLKIHLSTMEWEYLEMPVITQGILGMTQEGNRVWFTEYDVEAEIFFQWNFDNGNITAIELPCRDCFYAPLYCNDSLLFSPNFGKKSYLYGIESGKWVDVSDILHGLKKSSDKKVQKDEIVYFDNRNKKYCHWNLRINEFYDDKIQIREKEFLEHAWFHHCEKYRQEFKDQAVKENKLELKDYLDIICAIL